MPEIDFASKPQNSLITDNDIKIIINSIDKELKYIKGK
jgi:hypothetical protein